VGSFSYAVQIPPLAGESQTNDNTFVVNVLVVDSRNRLLYVENVPRWESKFLIRLLNGSKNVTPISFVRGPGNRFLAFGDREGMALDMTDEQLTRYKIVILGDLDAEGLTPERAASLVRFVDSGASLILLGGPAAWGPKGFAATELKKLLPVQRDWTRPTEPGSFALTLTDDGRSHPAFQGAQNEWKRVPPVLSIFSGATLSPGAVSLVAAKAPAGPQPIVVTQRYGQGKVTVILTDSLWRWQMDPASSASYALFWNQMLQWLSPSETEVSPYELDLFADADQMFLGETLRLNGRLGGVKEAEAKGSVVCEVTAPDGRRLSLAMTRRTVIAESGKSFVGYGADYTPEAPGLYRAVARTEANKTAIESTPFSFFVKPYTPESNPRAANTELLKKLSAASGGAFCEPEELGGILSKLKVTTREEQRVTFSSLWDTIPVLGCLIALLTVEWIVRRSRNLA
jgi:uncharacterized membrane protein